MKTNTQTQTDFMKFTYTSRQETNLYTTVKLLNIGNYAKRAKVQSKTVSKSSRGHITGPLNIVQAFYLHGYKLFTCTATSILLHIQVLYK